MKLISFVLACLMPCSALAEPDRLSFLLGSEHLGATRDFNEFNPGVFLTWETKTFDYSVGAFYNSYEGVSALGSMGYNYEVARDLDIGAFAGLAYYPGEGDQFDVSVGDVIPIVGLQTRYRQAFVQYIPADGDTVDGLVTFGLSFDISKDSR